MGRGLSRRAFLLGAGGAALAACTSREGPTDRVTAPTTTTAPGPAALDAPTVAGLKSDPFTLGVAAGDPRPHGVVLWTRLAPDPLAGGGMADEDASVVWEVAHDPGFTTLATTGRAAAPARHAHSVHVAIAALDPDTTYHYRFRAGAFTSPAGRFRTLPPAGGVDRLAFTACACQDDQDGFRTAYAHLADEEGVAFNLWLGDYIYETESDPDRFLPNGLPEAVDLAGYRDRYARAKLDPALQAAHAAMAWIVTWDDHEVVNNYAGLVDQDGTDPAVFAARRAAAYQAWWEHQPVDVPPPDGPDLDIVRVVDIGSLARFIVLDTRQHRDDQACGAQLFLNLACGQELDAGRTLLGGPQLAVLEEALSTTSATWNVVAQQIVMTPLPIASDGVVRVCLDAWDGYVAERARVMELLAGVANPIVLSADFHAGLVADLPAEGHLGAAPVATEFGTGSVSSAFPRDFVDVVEQGVAALDHVHHFDNRHRGYLRCDVTPNEWRAEFRVVTTTFESTSALSPGSVWTVPAGGVTASPA